VNEGFVTRNLGLVPYREAYALQCELHAAVAERREPPTLLILEHPAVITHGRKDGEDTNLAVPRAELEARGIEVVSTERGGSVTYHGPGQLVGYPIFPVGRRVRDFLRRLENALVVALAPYGLAARPNPGYAGVYVGEEKVASIGVAVSRHVAMHGFALNVNTRIEDFDLIVPCGLEGVRMTSLERLIGRPVEMAGVRREVEAAVRGEFADYRWAEELAAAPLEVTQ
jgi:lipoyl(octanoyl) transferase